MRQTLVPLLTLVTLGATFGLAVATWGDNVSVISGAMVMDDLTLFLGFLFCRGGRGLRAARRGAGSRRARPGTASTTRCC